MRTERIIIAAAVFAVGVFIAVLPSCKDAQAGDVTGYTPPMSTHADTVKRGEYLVTVLGCNDCHSAKKFGPAGPVIDSATMLGGFIASNGVPKASKVNGPWMLFAPDLTAAVGSWGMSFAANISSDDTGIGTWSEEQFFRVLREGKYKGLSNSRNLLPPMPWQGYKKLPDDEIRAIFAYLKSTKPVKNIVPAPIAPDKL